MASARGAGFLILVALGAAFGAVRSGKDALGRQDTAPRQISASAPATELPDGAWVTLRGRIAPSTLWQQASFGDAVVAYQLEGGTEGLVIVVPLSMAEPLRDPQLWKRAGLVAAVLGAVKDAGADAQEAEAEPAPATLAYIAEERELTGLVFDPKAALNTEKVEIGTARVKITGFGSYCSSNTCGSNVRAIVIGHKPPQRSSSTTEMLGWAALAIASLFFAIRLLRGPRVAFVAAPSVTRGAQLAGEQCAECSKSILSDNHGSHCAECGAALHVKGCLGAHAASAHPKAPSEPYRG